MLFLVSMLGSVGCTEQPTQNPVSDKMTACLGKYAGHGVVQTTGTTPALEGAVLYV